MTPKFTRLLLLATVAAGFGVLPMSGASAATDRGIVVYDMPTGFQQDVNANGQCHTTSDFTKMPVTEIDPGDSVSWFMNSQNQGKHNVTPANDVPGGQHWAAGVQKSDDLAAGADPFVVHFDKAAPGYYFYYSSVDGEGSDSKGKLDGMCGAIHVRGAAPTTTTTPDTTPTTQPTTDTTAAPATPGTTATTAPVSAVPSATHPATPAAPAPTTTAPPKSEKDHKPKDETTTTTTAPPVNGPVDLPAEAIVPNINPTGSATQDGIVAPSSTPTGDAAAIIKTKHGHGPVILLIVSGLGIGGLAVGTAAYKWANRASKYFPA
ncbi:MAG TPA: hypothetical protein VFE55_21275 [Acidimicrobiia bacterium]|nr:hypothetical protein [Acidimicrobiia bacterium]